MPGSWVDRQIRRMLGHDVLHPLATTHRHVAWENPTLRLECNLVRNVATSVDGFAVRITPATDPTYAAVVVPVSPGGRLHLVARYRYAIARWSIEFPRFEFDSSDAGWKGSAEADLRRATGLSARRMHLMGEVLIDPALMSNSTIVILAEGCTRGRVKAKVGATTPQTPPASSEREELIAGSLVLSRDELVDLAARGEIACGVTLAAWALYQARQP